MLMNNKMMNDESNDKCYYEKKDKFYEVLKTLNTNDVFLITSDRDRQCPKAKKFAYFQSYDEFNAVYSQLKPEDKIFYEFFPENKPIHEYYDIDIEMDSIPEEFRCKLKNNQERVFHIFNHFHIKFRKHNTLLGFTEKKEVFDDEPEEEEAPDWRISDASRFTTAKNKISLHLVNRSRIWRNLEEAKTFVTQFKEFVMKLPALEKADAFFGNPTDSKFILFDTGVYGSSQSMRMLYSSKLEEIIETGKPRPLEKARWHSKSIDAPDTDFYIQLLNPKIDIGSTPFGSVLRVESILEPTGKSTTNNPVNPNSSSTVQFLGEEFNRVSLTRILESLNDKRFVERDDWMKFIWIACKYGIPRDIIHFHSRRAKDKYDKVGTDKMIDDFNRDKCTLTYATLFHWLKTDITTACMAKHGQNYAEAGAEIKKTYKDIVSSICFDRDDYNIFRQDVGLAELLNKHYAKGNIKVTDESGEGYVWNEEEKLWKKTCATIIQNNCMHFLDKFVTKKQKDISEKMNELLEEDDSKEGATQSRKKNDEDKNTKLLAYDFVLKKTIRARKNITNIYKTCMTELYDDKFESNKNSIPHLLPIKDGLVLNLKTKTTEPRTKEHCFTMSLNVTFIPTGRSSEQEVVVSFFKSICRKLTNGAPAWTGALRPLRVPGEHGKRKHFENVEDPEYVDFMQRLLGYCLTGEVNERSLYVMYGTGRNGKSTLCNILEKILGDYNVSCSNDVLIQSEKRSGATPELVKLQTARVAIVSETNEGEKLNKKNVKNLTGNDTIYCRDLFQKSGMNFKVKCKFLMMTNSRPEFDINDTAMTDRIKALPFNAKFENTPENIKYVNSLTTDYLDDFFSWMVEGAYKWYQGNALVPCQTMVDGQKDWLEDMDTLKRFIDEKCEINEKYTESVNQLVYEYKEFTRQTISTMQFNKQMKLKGFIISRNKTQYKGLKLVRDNAKKANSSDSDSDSDDSEK
jgi:P4 family phage/plasmid primase-like protien